jgi:hypothetical protein
LGTALRGNHVFGALTTFRGGDEFAVIALLKKRTQGPQFHLFTLGFGSNKFKPALNDRAQTGIMALGYKAAGEPVLLIG